MKKAILKYRMAYILSFIHHSHLVSIFLSDELFLSILFMAGVIEPTKLAYLFLF